MPPDGNARNSGPSFEQRQKNLDEPITNSKWTTVFPQNLSDEVSSQRFMVRAVFVAFSSVLRYRKILPEHCFRSMYITENVKVKSLDYKNSIGCTVASKLRSAGEAIKAGYLDELALVVYLDEKDEDDAAEVFTWKMHYDDGIPYAELSSGSDSDSSLVRLAAVKYEGSHKVRDQFVIMMRSIIYLCVKLLKPLPETASANFRIKFRDHTPKDYSVSEFHDSQTFYRLPPEIQSATIGNVRSGLHGTVLNCTSIYLEDTLDAELKLKKMTEEYADNMGLSQSEILYQSFTSHDVSARESPPAVEVPRAASRHEEPEAMEVDTEVVALEESSHSGSTKEKKTRGRPKAAPRTKAQKIEKKKSPMKAPAKRFGRVHTLTGSSPDKR
ncbi:unnamed protein product [Caenorhabditis auriculariae]|uniref:HORMA domain-containing protein n=1 Tax=Caenorhabditis auriculariae TaxID=2777116 RepID=A0A8S1HMC6_9PELO|nr:unnamed protein product [Caenorhabditis auriculariae]